MINRSNYLLKDIMKSKIEEIFKKNNNIVIGAIHFPPLLGYAESPGLDVALENALADLKAFERGGVDGIIFENNYDLPHKIFVDPSTIAAMTFLGEKLRRATDLPLGISVLWNDYRAAFCIARILGLQFIRVPVFVDKVRTNYGVVTGNARDVINFRKGIGAKSVAVFADIHVKHAKLLSKHSLAQSARLAIKNHADGLIITGKWTGVSPEIERIKRLREKIPYFPILIGSGMDARNARDLFHFANAAIVSTSLKKGSARSGEVNVKGCDQRIDVKKVKALVARLKNDKH